MAHTQFDKVRLAKLEELDPALLEEIAGNAALRASLDGHPAIVVEGPLPLEIDEDDLETAAVHFVVVQGENEKQTMIQGVGRPIPAPSGTPVDERRWRGIASAAQLRPASGAEEIDPRGAKNPWPREIKLTPRPPSTNGGSHTHQHHELEVRAIGVAVVLKLNQEGAPIGYDTRVWCERLDVEPVTGPAVTAAATGATP